MADTRRVVVVRGAAGAGKSALAVELVRGFVAAGGDPAGALLLTPSRTAAARLRADADAAVDVVTTGEIVRTWSSLAFDLVRRRAELVGEEAPRLISGAEQDVLLGELLALHAAAGTGPRWPEELAPALRTRGMRGELRDLFMRALEHGLGPADLAEQGRAHGRPDWEAAAALLDEYQAITVLSSPPALDPASLLLAAGDALDPGPGAPARERALAEAVTAQVRLVVVDDAHELSRSAARLVALVAGGGAKVVLVGDPDAAVEGFRGGEASLLGELAGLWDAAELDLTVGHRVPAGIRAAVDRVVERLPATGRTTHRHVTSPEGGCLRVDVLPTESGEAAHVAATLRRWHLLDGVPYEEMAVVLRGRGRQEALSRTLAMYGVPVAVSGGGVALRDEPAVWPLLLCLRVVLSLTAEDDAATALGPEEGKALLGSVIGRASAVDLRRLSRVLRRAARDAGLDLDAEAQLVAACLDIGALPLTGPEAEPARRVSRVITAGRAAATAPGATAHSILWALWEATGLQEEWRQAALAGGERGRRADLDLDAVVALMRTAEVYVERLPHEAPMTFLEHVSGQDLAADTLAPRAQVRGTVTLTTAQGAAGRGWRRVIVAGVQEGVWPDLRLRGSLLGSEELVDAVLGRDGSVRARQAATRADELRSFHVALTRAREEVLVTAVSGREQAPSPFLDLVDPLPPEAPERPVTQVEVPLTARTMTALARRDLTEAVLAGADEQTGSDERAARAAGRLAALTPVVPAAHPSQWWGLRGVSDARPLVVDGRPVRVSPSRVELYTRCPLRWFLQSRGGESGQVGAAAVGTLVHEVIEEMPHAGLGTLQDRLEERWAQERLGDGWLDRRTRDGALRMLERYVEFRAAAEEEGWALLASEVPFDVRVGRARVVGRVDRVEGRRGKVRIVDFKTGTTMPTKSEAEEHPQLGIYQLAVESDALEGCPAGTGASAGAQLLFLAMDTLGSAVREQPPPAAFAAALVERAADGMAQAVQPATPSDKVCRGCPVQTSCPAVPKGGEDE